MSHCQGRWQKKKKKRQRRERLWRHEHENEQYVLGDDDTTSRGRLINGRLAKSACFVVSLRARFQGPAVRQTGRRFEAKTRFSFSKTSSNPLRLCLTCHVVV